MDSPLLPAAASADRETAAARACPTCSSSSPALVFAMVVIGGITRLTESGLSITEWKPISGAIPPLTPRRLAARLRPLSADAAISQVAGPAGMTLSGFKFIFFWEWVHRLARPGHRPRLLRRRRLVRGQARDPAAATAGGSRAVRPRRAAGRGRLVHGDVRARRPDRGQPLSPVGPSAVRAVPVRAR